MKTKFFFQLSVFAIMLVGCGPTPATLDYDEGEFVGYKVHYDGPQAEQWDDPDTLSTPRLQFVWRHPEESTQKQGIWSMRFDGSDLRLAASRELLDQPTPGATRNNRVPIRSPNNRYIAVSMVTLCNTCAALRIVDLKTQTIKQLDRKKYDGGANLQWTADSRYLVFNGRGMLLEHDVHTNETQVIVKRFYDGHNPGFFHLLEGGKKIMFERNNQRFIHDYKTGELLSTLEGGAYNAPLSEDDKYYITNRNLKRDYPSNYALSTFEEPTKEVAFLHAELGYYNTVTMGGMGPVFNISRNDIKKAMPNEDRIIRYSLPSEGSIIDTLSIYNAEKFIKK